MLRRVFAMFMLCGALIGFAVSLKLPRHYVGRGSLLFESPASMQNAAETTLSVRSLSAIIFQSAYYQPMLSYTPVEELVEEIRRNCSIEPNGMVQYKDDDEYAALDVTRRLVEELKKNAGASARVKEPVRLQLTGPTPALCTFEGILAGLALGLCVWFGLSRSAPAG